MPTYQVTYELQDAYGRKTRKRFETISSIADHAAAVAAANTLAVALADLTELDILAHNVSLRTIYSDSVVAGANKDEGVTLTLQKADNYNAAIKVPGPINAIFNADGSVDLSNAIVTAFVNEFLVGADFTFSDGEQANSLVSGRLDK